MWIEFASDSLVLHVTLSQVLITVYALHRCFHCLMSLLENLLGISFFLSSLLFFYFPMSLSIEQFKDSPSCI